jgi:hypothetical protein
LALSPKGGDAMFDIFKFIKDIAEATSNIKLITDFVKEVCRYIKNNKK